MSGICGIVSLDGAPVERECLEDMTAFLALRGPDGQGLRIDGAAGLGHTLLRTTFEAAHERQPASLDGAVWICADARIDARAELREKLGLEGDAAAATDAQLILHAYRAWGEDCVAHLLGDFAFAIWDGPRRRLFCARDHFGVKPFFYTHRGDRFVFSNTLDCVRRDPAVSSELDDLSIADFLLFEMNQDPAASAFAAIRRLPPAHCLTASSEGVRTRQYWTLPLDTQVRYRSANDYVDHFRHLLGIAVADRLRTDRVGVELTGGLDSTTVAATAMALLAGDPRPFGINALTVVYDRLIPDEERGYAGMVADRLGIPIHFFVADEYKLYERCDGLENHPPEPSHDPGAAATLDSLRREASFGRVVLTGWDGDALFTESPKPYFRSLFKARRWGRLAAGVVRYGVSQRRLIPLTVRAWLDPRGAGAALPRPAFPQWLAPELVSRLDLRSRWDHAHDEPQLSHPVRPYAFGTLSQLMRQSNFFEYSDAGVTRVPLEHRHPLMDLRLQGFCLSLPPLPWCVKKTILREAMRGILPERVRRRPKAPLAGWPAMELLREPEAQWIDRFVPARELSRYVDRSRIPSVCAESDREERWRDLRPLSLSVWLRNLAAANARSPGWTA